MFALRVRHDDDVMLLALLIVAVAAGTPGDDGAVRGLLAR